MSNHQVSSDGKHNGRAVYTTSGGNSGRNSNSDNVYNSFLGTNSNDKNSSGGDSFYMNNVNK